MCCLIESDITSFVIRSANYLDCCGVIGPLEGVHSCVLLFQVSQLSSSMLNIVIAVCHCFTEYL